MYPNILCIHVDVLIYMEPELWSEWMGATANEYDIENHSMKYQNP